MTAMKTTVSTEMQQEAAEAVRILREGGIILYPTDTVWGLGCDATNAAAVERIYRLKRSENKKSMLVLCASADMTVRYVNKAPGIAFEVMEMATKPLTLILPGAAGVAENLIPDEGTLGVRIPDHAFCQLMLRGLKRPIVSTSANISGCATPAGLDEVAREIIDLIMRGVCSVEDADKALTFGPGIRWAIMGQNLLYQLGNPKGIKGTWHCLRSAMAGRRASCSPIPPMRDGRLFW